MRTVHSLAHWFCAQLTRSELVEAVALLQEVVAGHRDDIRLKKEFREQHPNYRRYTVDTTPPLTDPPEQRLSAWTLDWRELLDRYKLEKGRALAPIIPHGGRRPPAGSRCERCGAPAEYLYVNNGKKADQLRCKVCKLPFPVRQVRREAKGPFWCPYCGKAMFEWKHDENQTV